MFHSLKLNGVRAIIDSRDGSYTAIDALTQQLFDEIGNEIANAETPELPMGVRYTLAKFDSGALKSSYRSLFDLLHSEKDCASCDDIVYYEVDASAIDSVTIPSSAKFVLVNAQSSQEAIDALTKINFDCKKAARIPVGENVDSLNDYDIVFVYGDLSDKEKFLSYCDDRIIPELHYSDNDTISEFVLSALKSGKKFVNAVPTSDSDENKVSEMLYKLSRDILRYQKSGGKGLFLPFTFSHAFTGIECKGFYADNGIVKSIDQDSFAWIYSLNGFIFHVSCDKQKVFETCVECAVMLSLSK